MFEKSISDYLQKHGYPHLQLKAALFDMDGVLFNSMPYHADAWHKVMERHGLHLSREEAYLHEGRTGASTINIVYQRQFGKDASPEQGIQLAPRTRTDAGCLGNTAEGQGGRHYPRFGDRLRTTLAAGPPDT